MKNKLAQLVIAIVLFWIILPELFAVYYYYIFSEMSLSIIPKILSKSHVSNLLIHEGVTKIVPFLAGFYLINQKDKNSDLNKFGVVLVILLLLGIVLAIHNYFLYPEIIAKDMEGGHVLKSAIIDSSKNTISNFITYILIILGINYSKRNE